MKNKQTPKQSELPPDRSKENHEDAVKRYLDHPKEETFEQRKARINRFRCGY